MSVEINVFNPKKFYVAGDVLEGMSTLIFLVKHH